MNTCLIVCHTLEGLSRLPQLAPGHTYVLASDDPRVQEKARSIAGVTAIFFLERGESFYRVAPEVRRVLSEIDCELRGLDPSSAPELLSWGFNVEGGIMAQRIQDLALMLRSFRGLIEQSMCDSILLVLDPDRGWQDQVLIRVARHEGKPVQLVKTRQLAEIKHQWRRTLRPFAVLAYHTLNLLLYSRCFLGRPQVASLNGQVIFQSQSSLAKHVENIRPLMHALTRRKQPCTALCWSTAERFTAVPSHRQLRSAGLQTVAMEKLLGPADLIAGFVSAFTVSIRASRQKKFLGQVSIDGLPIKPLLKESWWHFFFAELPQRVWYFRAIRRCAGWGRPVALKPWGGPESFEGKAARSVFGDSCFIFHYWLGASLDWPYVDPESHLDLFLAKGCHEVQLAQKNYRLRPDQVEVVGQARFGGYEEFARTHSAEESRRELSLPIDGILYVAFDPNGALRGYQSTREQVEMLGALAALARACQGTVIVIKPHPSYSVEHLKPGFAAFPPSSLYLLDRRAPLKHFINACDVLVTKYSTLVLEAALMSRPAVAALFDQEPRFAIFGGLAETTTSPQQLTTLLSRLAASPPEFQEWRRQQLNSQKKHLPDYCSGSDIDPSEMGADAIMRRLEGIPSCPIR